MIGKTSYDTILANVTAFVARYSEKNSWAKATRDEVDELLKGYLKASIELKTGITSNMSALYSSQSALLSKTLESAEWDNSSVNKDRAVVILQGLWNATRADSQDDEYINAYKSKSVVPSDPSGSVKPTENETVSTGGGFSPLKLAAVAVGVYFIFKMVSVKK